MFCSWAQSRCHATTFVTIVGTFPSFPLVNVGNENIRPHEETSTLREERGVSTTEFDEGCGLAYFSARDYSSRFGRQ